MSNATHNGTFALQKWRWSVVAICMQRLIPTRLLVGAKTQLILFNSVGQTLSRSFAESGVWLREMTTRPTIYRIAFGTCAPRHKHLFTSITETSHTDHITTVHAVPQVLEKIKNAKTELFSNPIYFVTTISNCTMYYLL